MKSFFKCLAVVNPVSLTIGSILLAMALFVYSIPILDMIELRTYDLRLRSRQPRQPSPAVVLAMVDEKSLDAEGRWPWPRSKIAALVDRLSADGAKVIAFDIGFLEPDENARLHFLQELGLQLQSLSIEHDELSTFLHMSREGADHDRLLAEAIKRASADVVLGYFFHMDDNAEGYRLEPRDIAQHLQRIQSSKYPSVMFEDPDMGFSPFIQAYAPESNIPALTDVASASGYFSITSDADGIVRWMPLMIQVGGELFPPLSVVAAWHYLDKPPLVVHVGHYGVEGLRMGKRFIPTNENGQLLIDYPGPVKTFPHYSISDILSGELPVGTFQNKIVMVGATATGTYDMRSTPISPVYPGVEIHAAVIDNILTGRFLTRPNWSEIYDLIAIVALGLLAGAALSRLRALKGLVVTAGLFALHIVVARWLFGHAGVWLNLVYPLLTLSTTYVALTVYYYVTEERERQKIKGAFTHYVSAEVIDTMLEDPSRLKLGGDEKVLTVLFSDLQGFTSASERYTPTEMIDLLSEYYARMTEQVFDYGGMLKEYVGDELMAIFGAPVEQANHAKQACAAALAMRDRRVVLREEWARLGRPYLHARTGINSGLMLVGNLGSKYRFAYGVLGDHVNLGSRLEGLNKAYQTEILIGENTAELVGGDFLLREIDMAQVVGREQAVRIYELLGRAGTSLPLEQEKAYSSYAAGLEAYRQQFWDDAIGLFIECLSLWKGDGPSLTMLERCEIFQKTPPPEDWDGVFEALYK